MKFSCVDLIKVHGATVAGRKPNAAVFIRDLRLAVLVDHDVAIRCQKEDDGA